VRLYEESYPLSLSYQHENYNILPNFCVLNLKAQTCVGRSILKRCSKKLVNFFDLKKLQKLMNETGWFLINKVTYLVKDSKYDENLFLCVHCAP
jgi:hypothetical protein